MSSASVAWPEPLASAQLTMRPGDGALTVVAHADGSLAGGAFDLVLATSDVRTEASFDATRPERSSGSFTIDVGAIRVASLRRAGEPPALARAVPANVVERVHMLLTAAFGSTIRVEISGGVRSGAARFSFVAHLLRDGRAIPVPLVLTASIDGGGEVEVRGKGEVSLAALRSPPIDLASRAFRVRDRLAVELAVRLSDPRTRDRVDPRRG